MSVAILNSQTAFLHSLQQQMLACYTHKFELVPTEEKKKHEKFK